MSARHTLPEPPANAAMNDAGPWSIAKVLRWAADDFARRGHDSPRLDAELLLGHVLGVDRVRLILDAARPLSDAELVEYRELIKRRRRGEPIAYIRGEREFFGHRFLVDARVLVPRPDTETLVAAALDRTRPRSLYGRALDLCTGSGCVAIAFARERPTWKVTGADVSAAALDLARHNAERIGAARNTRWVLGDLFAPLAPEERFELVTANPPYIPSAEIAGLARDIRDFEPRLALDGGADGLDLVRRIVQRAPEFLTQYGVLALEIAYDQADRVTELLAARGFAQIQRRRDYGGHERVVSATFG
jgi:release factor glutamine methyltransferase